MGNSIKKFRNSLVLFGLVLLASAQTYAGDHDHHAALFLGGTTAAKHSAFTLGADYEYRLPMVDRLFGVGALVDYAFFSPGALVLGVPVFIHPVAALKLALAPILEYSAGHSAFGLRAGVGYGFHIDFLSIEPTVNMDYANKHIAWVYGINVGVGF